MMDSVIVVAGGSFQGKSLLSLKLACKLKYSAVICTDLIRNILKLQNPSVRCYSTSSYLLEKDEWLHQKEITSRLLENVLDIYRARGEKIIVEGIHFTKSFLLSVQQRNGILFCLNNRTPFLSRIEKKTVTRMKLSGFDPSNADWVKESRYSKYQTRMDEIHLETLTICRELNAHIINYQNLDQGYKEIMSILHTVKQK